jgi:uncharacterized DUF497 family protein
VEIEFDVGKDEANRRKHGVSLALAAAMDFDEALVIPDERSDYGEARFRRSARSMAACMCWPFTMRGNTLRAISLRKANPRERRRYEQRQ